jgi:hypothetical protein
LQLIVIESTFFAQELSSSFTISPVCVRSVREDAHISCETKIFLIERVEHNHLVDATKEFITVSVRTLAERKKKEKKEKHESSLRRVYTA